MNLEQYKNNKKYQVGALKRRFGIKGSIEPGTLISKANEKKAQAILQKKEMSKGKLSIMGLI